MNSAENILAKKYATAFLNLYLDTISFDDYKNLKKIALYFKNNTKLFFLLNTPTASAEVKQKVMLTFFQELHIPPSLNKLVLLILKHHRVFLIPATFEQLTKIYEERKKIVPCIFSSSYVLEHAQLEILKKFLEKTTHYQITYTPKYDKKLIAGIRIQSSIFLWEYSVAKQLRELSKTIR